MNKIFKVTSVSAAALLISATGATAAEKPTLSIGGFMDQKFTVHKHDDSFTRANGTKANFDQRNDTEVHFDGSVTLDNGVKIRTRVEAEGFSINDTTNDGANFVNGTASQPDMIDEAWMDFTGTFGAIRLGSTDMAGKRMTTGHQPTFFMNVGENTRFNITKVITQPSTVSGSVISQLDLSSDGESVSYVSPRMAGFQIGAGWAATANEDSDAATLKSAADHDIFDVALNWVGKFGDVGLSVAAGYTGAKDQAANTDDPHQFLIGGRITIGGLAFGVSYQKNENPGTATADTEETITEFGVRYITGPNAFSVVAAFNEFGGNVAASKNDKSQAYSIAYRRTLAPGVDWHNTLHIANYDDGAVGAAAGNSNDGYAFTTGVLINF